jgi:hypothetical protein
MLIALREKVLTQQKTLQTTLLSKILGIFNLSLGLKRVDKLLRNTEGFETISQEDFWAPIHFSPNLRDVEKVMSLWFSLRISLQKSFKKHFVENYATLVRRYISGENGKFWAQMIVNSISQIILESNQGELLLKLASELPEKGSIISLKGEDTLLNNRQKLLELARRKEQLENELQRLKLAEGEITEITENPQKRRAEFVGTMMEKLSTYHNSVRAFVRCAKCNILEKSEKEFQKCSRCGLVFYCSKDCQREDWGNHKRVCKEIRNQN